MVLGKGIGKVTTQIFSARIAGYWCKAMPPLSPPALRAAKELGYLSDHVNNDAMVIIRLRQLWTDSRQSIKEFTRVKAALVHYGLHLRHHKLS